MCTIRDPSMTLPHEAAVERWLREEVVPTLNAAAANPDRLLTPEEFRHGLHAHIDALAAKRFSTT